MTTKERLHKLVEQLSDRQAEAVLAILERRRHDQMVLASAPLDDEPADADEDAGAAEALAATSAEKTFPPIDCAPSSTLIDLGVDPKYLRVAIP